MLRSKEVAPRVLAAVLAISAGAYAGVELGDDGPPSFKEQISKALGESSIRASSLSVNAKKGIFTFHQGQGRNEEICKGRFGSEDGIHADIGAFLGCKMLHPGPTILHMEPSVPSEGR